MTTDAFTEAARAEAERRNPSNAPKGLTRASNAISRRDFRDGAEWARDHLAQQEPTDAEVQASKAEAILMDGFDMAVADHLADAGYTEYAEDEDGGVTWVSAPLGEVLHIVRISATEYETGDRA